MGEVIIISTCLSVKIKKGACSTNGPANVRRDDSLYLPWQENDHISSCWMQNGILPPRDPGKSTERAFDLQHHSRCTHNRHHQHVRPQLKDTQMNTMSRGTRVQPHKYKQINNQHKWQHCSALHELHHADRWHTNMEQGNLRHSERREVQYWATGKRDMEIFHLHAQVPAPGALLQWWADLFIFNQLLMSAVN